MAGSYELSPRYLRGDLLALLAGPALRRLSDHRRARPRRRSRRCPLLFLASRSARPCCCPSPSALASKCCRRIGLRAAARARQPGARPGAAGLCDRHDAAAWSSALPCSPSRRFRRLIGWLAYDETLTALDWVGAVGDRRWRWSSCGCPSGACAAATPKPKMAADGRPLTARSKRCASASRSRSASMRCSTAGPQRRSKRPRPSSASTAPRRGSPCPRTRPALIDALRPGGRRGDGGAFPPETRSPR